jgi:hypothetical protein
MFAFVRKTTDRAITVNTASCSTRGNKPRTIGSTFARLSETVSASGS